MVLAQKFCFWVSLSQSTTAGRWTDKCSAHRSLQIKCPVMRFERMNAIFLVHRHLVRISQDTHYVSGTETNRLMLFGKTVAGYWENHAEHTDAVRTSQETNYVSATETNQSVLFGETVAVCCENHTEHKNALGWQNVDYLLFKAGGTCSNHWSLRAN
jgi:hypothetical protein